MQKSKLKAGRPKSINKAINRVHSVVLTDKAEVYFRQAVKARGGDKRWFNRFVSEIIIRELCTTEEAYLVHKLNVLQKQRNEIEEEIAHIATKLKHAKEATQLQKVCGN